MKSWTLDASHTIAAPREIGYAPMRDQRALDPLPFLALRQQADYWAGELRMPKLAAWIWLVIAGAGRKWRALAENPEACEAYDSLSAWRPSPNIWTNFSVVPEGFGAADAPDDALTRAARLVLAARDVRSDFIERRLAPEYAGKHPLDLSQMVNVFRGIGLHGAKPRWCEPAGDADYFCVFSRGIPYFLPMPAPGTGVAAVRAALAGIARDESACNEPSVAPLSALGIKALKRAGLDRSADVPPLANAIAAARFVLCLDLDSSPEDDCRAGRLTLVSFLNRWYLHGCNLVAFGNGAVGIHLSFGAGIDGNVGVRFAAEVAQRLRNAEKGAARLEETGAAYAAFVRGGPVRLSARLETQFQTEAIGWTKTSPGVFTLPLGEAACHASGARPVESFVIALSAALAGLAGRRPGRLCRIPIKQFVSQGRYKFGTLNAATVNTPEVFAVARLLHRPAAEQPAALRELYAAAEGVMRECTERARHIRTFNRSLTRGPGRRMLAYLAVAPVLLAFRAWSRLARPRAAIVEAAISYVSKKDGIAIVARPGARAPRGMLWLHYQIFADRTVVVPCLGADSPLSEQQLMDHLGRHWKSLLDRLAAAGLK